MQAFFGILVFFLWMVFFFTWRLRRADRRRGQLSQSLAQDEINANYTRKKEIDPGLFYIPDLSALPETEADGAREKVLRCAGRKMIRFQQRMTNLSLKMAYGAAQLEVIAQYEENFQNYLAALIAWAEKLIASGHTADAVRILEQTVALGSEYRKSYIITANLYAEARAFQKLDALLAAAEACDFTDDVIKRQVMAHINQKRNEAGT